MLESCTRSSEEGTHRPALNKAIALGFTRNLQFLWGEGSPPVTAPSPAILIAILLRGFGFQCSDCIDGGGGVDGGGGCKVLGGTDDSAGEGTGAGETESAEGAEGEHFVGVVGGEGWDFLVWKIAAWMCYFAKTLSHMLLSNRQQLNIIYCNKTQEKHR